MTNLAVIHEAALVKEIMAAIESYHDTHDIAPEPEAIRNLMLCVAGLLHIDAFGGSGARQDPHLEDTFLDHARDCLTKVRDASKSGLGSLLQ